MLTDNEALVEQRHNLSHHEQVDDAQSQCVPCKLCGGKAVITDAGTGAGYYIACENGSTFKASKGCLLDSRRLGGWAYNVMDWWNRLHGTTDAARIAALEAILTDPTKDATVKVRNALATLRSNTNDRN